MLAGDVWTIYDTTNSGLPHNVVWALAFDASDRLWAGTLNGLARLDGTTWNVFTPENSGLPSSDIASVLCVQGDTVWIGTWGAGLVRYDGTAWVTFSASNSSLPNNFIEALTVDRKGALWIGTGGGGVVRFDGMNWSVYDSASSDLPNNAIRALVYDGRENLWMATQRGVCVYRKGGVVLTSVQQFAVSSPDPDPVLVINAFPNPTNASFTISWKSEESLAGTIGVFDILGRSVLPPIDASSNGAGSFTRLVDASSLPSGMYVVRMLAFAAPNGISKRSPSIASVRLILTR